MVAGAGRDQGAGGTSGKVGVGGYWILCLGDAAVRSPSPSVERRLPLGRRAVGATDAAALLGRRVS